MNIIGLFSTKERLALLRAVIYRAGPFGVGELARKTGLSKGLVSQFLKMMRKEGLLGRKGNRYTVSENLKTASVRLFLNLSGFDSAVLRKFKFVRRAGLYGSFAKGTNTEESDIDLWVLVEGAPETGLASLTKALKAIDDRIKPLYLTREKLARLKKEEQTFYYSLFFGTINVFGEGNEPI